MQSLKLYASLAAGSLLLAACSSTPLDNKPAPVESRGAATTTAPATADARSVGTVNAATDPLNDPKGVLAKRSVYFDFDSYVLRTQDKPVAEAHAAYLTKHKNRNILIQGNTDERGGSEYNLALGQKRAEALKKSLSLLGVSESQMEAVSLGKEKPKALGHDETSWAENRRADIIYR